MARKKKTKKPKSKGEGGAEEDVGSPKQEYDAVKWFIVVMILLIGALGVFIVITLGQVNEIEEEGLDRAKRMAPSLGERALEIQEYTKIIRNSQDLTLLRFPERFFSAIYQRAGIAQSQVRLRTRREVPNRRERYTEISWELEMEGITRQQAVNFCQGVEADSPKAKIIEISLRRSRRREAGDDEWDASFKVGYRIAGTERT